MQELETILGVVMAMLCKGGTRHATKQAMPNTAGIAH